MAWHLPLFLTGQILLPDILVIMAASVVIAGLFRSARQSVLIAMVFHATNNAVGVATPVSSSTAPTRSGSASSPPEPGGSWPSS
ncbi:hypothetical protein [Streptosporangium sp. NPDC006007]|uniref:hypothetical protein n=1 Tax=Streptosporangium sp. NPDC006007 TaxID=3154575 RepID=UPI0033AAA08A